MHYPWRRSLFFCLHFNCVLEHYPDIACTSEFVLFKYELSGLCYLLSLFLLLAENLRQYDKRSNRKKLLLRIRLVLQDNGNPVAWLTYIRILTQYFYCTCMVGCMKTKPWLSSIVAGSKMHGHSWAVINNYCSRCWICTFLDCVNGITPDCAIGCFGAHILILVRLILVRISYLNCWLGGQTVSGCN